MWDTLSIMHLPFIGIKLYLELLAVVWWFSLDFCYISFIQFTFLLHFLYYISPESDNNVQSSLCAKCNDEIRIRFHLSSLYSSKYNNICSWYGLLSLHYETNMIGRCIKVASGMLIWQNGLHTALIGSLQYNLLCITLPEVQRTGGWKALISSLLPPLTQPSVKCHCNVSPCIKCSPCHSQLTFPPSHSFPHFLDWKANW